MEHNERGSRSRAVSQMLALLLLTLIIVISTFTIHSTITSIGVGQEAEDTAGILSSILIEEVLPLRDEFNPSYCPALDLVLRNPSTDPMSLRGVGVYVEQDDKRSLGYHLPLQGYRSVEPGSTVRVRFYMIEDAGPGVVRVFLATRASLSDAYEVFLPCRLAAGDAAVLRRPGDVVELRVEEATIVAWLERVENGGIVTYWVHYNITVDHPLPAGSVRGEILVRGLDHPLGVASPVFHNSLDYEPSVVYSGYWAGVREPELPVLVFWSVLDSD